MSEDVWALGHRSRLLVHLLYTGHHTARLCDFHPVCHQETGDRPIEVLVGRLTREGEPKAGQEFSQIGKQMEHLLIVFMHALSLSIVLFRYHNYTTKKV